MLFSLSLPTLPTTLLSRDAAPKTEKLTQFHLAPPPLLLHPASFHSDCTISIIA
uniref:Uncharacterized protein n=1 Tax=Ficus carica TaxID=3494 RepID=A0AA88E9B5_FICCA|nr:hypothetical protein TIFTF001_039525 [Ficus carica]